MQGAERTVAAQISTNKLIAPARTTQRMIRLTCDIDPSGKSPKNREPLAGAVYASLNRPHNADSAGARLRPSLRKVVKRALNSGIF